MKLRLKSAVVGHIPGNTSFINRMNTAMEIIAIHHGLNITGNRTKTGMNANQRHPDGLLSSAPTSIPYAALKVAHYQKRS
jgi:hypothetical protein